MLHHSVSWLTHHQLIQEIYNRIQLQPNQPNIIVAIGRGGLIPATILANFLSIHEVYNYGVKSYNTENKQQSAEIIQSLPPSLDKKSNTILIVDDLLDSGRTMADLRNQFKQATILTCTLYVKDVSLMPPNHIFCKTVNSSQWVVFPWEVYDAV